MYFKFLKKKAIPCNIQAFWGFRQICAYDSCKPAILCTNTFKTSSKLMAMIHNPCMLVKLYVGPVTPWMWDMLQKLELNVDDRGMYYKYLVHEVYIPPKQKINVKNNLLV